MINAFNEPLAAYKGGDTYNETICFNYDSETEEFANETELYVDAQNITFDDHHLTKSQASQVQSFAEEIQNEMIAADRYANDIKETENWLIKNP